MANHKSGAQRYNDRMDKIFEESKRLNMKYHGVDHFGSQDNRSEAMKKALEKKKDNFTTAAMRAKAQRLNEAKKNPTWGKEKPF